MTTVTQRLMSGLGQAGSDWSWSWTVSIHDTSYSPQVTEELVSEQDTTDKAHDNSSGTSDLQDLYEYYSMANASDSENIR